MIMKKGNPSVLVAASAVILTTVLLIAFTSAPVAAQSTGSLRVFINPQDAADGGAMWRLAEVSNAAWQYSGDTVSNIYPGTYTVEFSGVSGWATPAPEQVVIIRGRTALLTVTYQRTSQGYGQGRLIVNIGPVEAVDDGAMWRIQGTDYWLRSSEVYESAPVGQQVIEFTDLNGWERPVDQVVNVIRGRTTTLNVNYVSLWGALTVTIDPQEVVDAGAMWRRQGTVNWFANGQTETGVIAGSYIVEFSPIEYWISPSVKSIRVNAGQTAAVTALYRRDQGFLTVNIGPQDALTDGAQWRLKGEENWHSSGLTLRNVQAGEVIVQFKTIAGWDNPEDIALIVNSQRTATATANYIRLKGALTVNIEPQEASEAGARWRIAEEGYDWRVSGSTKSNLVVGVITVEFKAIDGWETPAGQKIRVVEGQELSITGHYKAMRGSLTVTIEPQNAVDQGAEWRIVGTPNWHHSGRLREGLPFGQYVIEFNNIPDWNTPDNLQVTISPGEDVSVTGTYKAQRRGSLTVIIEPNGAVRDGAMWRVAGTQDWLQSGQATEKITPGQMTVEFKSAEGWKKPDPMVIEIAPREDKSVTATYVRKR
jgi:hypothetical protein